MPSFEVGSALHVACFLRHTEVVKILLSSGASPSTYRSVRGASTTILDTSAVKAALEAQGPPSIRKPGSTSDLRSLQPLILAVYGRHTDVVDLLVKRGTSPTDHHKFVRPLVRLSADALLPVKNNAVNLASELTNASQVLEQLKNSLQRVHVLVLWMESAKEAFMTSVTRISRHKQQLEFGKLCLSLVYLCKRSCIIDTHV